MLLGLVSQVDAACDYTNKGDCTDDTASGCRWNIGTSPDTAFCYQAPTEVSCIGWSTTENSYKCMGIYRAGSVWALDQSTITCSDVAQHQLNTNQGSPRKDEQCTCHDATVQCLSDYSCSAGAPGEYGCTAPSPTTAAPTPAPTPTPAAPSLYCMGTLQQKCKCISVGPGGYTSRSHTGGNCTNLDGYFFNPLTNTKCSSQTIECGCQADASGNVPLSCEVTSVSIQIPSAPTLTTSANGELCGNNGNPDICVNGGYLNPNNGLWNAMHTNTCVWAADWAKWGGGGSTLSTSLIGCFNAPVDTPVTTAAPTPAPTPQVICGNNARNTYRTKCCGVANPEQITDTGTNTGLNAHTTCSQLKAALEDAGCTACAA